MEWNNGLLVKRIEFWYGHSLFKHVSFICNLFYSHFLTIKKGSQNNYAWSQNYFTESRLIHRNTKIILDTMFWRDCAGQSVRPWQLLNGHSYSDGIIQVRPFTILDLNEFSNLVLEILWMTKYFFLPLFIPPPPSQCFPCPSSVFISSSSH